jgi:hypothetical protein
VGPAVCQELNDPTVKLNAGAYAAIKQHVLALPDGQAILDRAENAQGESVVIGVRHIYIGAVGAAILCAIFAVAMKELPLRKTVTDLPSGQPAGAAGAAPVPEAGGFSH